MRGLAALLLALAACGPREEPMRLKQRSEITIAPGVTLKVGDIELGSGAFLTVVEKGATIAQKETRAGDVFSFQAGGGKWEVEVVRLENHLTHEDYVHLFVRRK